MAKEFGEKVFCYVSYKVKEGQRQALMDAINAKRIQERYQEQLGNIEYRFFAPTNDKNLLYLVDIWEDQDTFDAHLHTDVGPDFAEIKKRYINDTTMIFQLGGK